MTFQEAQIKFSTIVGSITPATSSGDLLLKQRDLISLQNSLPISAEFDVIANAIAEFSPRLTGVITQAVLDSLKSREDTMVEASNLLTQVGKKADADARILTLEKPKLVAAALNETVVKLQELGQAAKKKDFETAASKVEALATLVHHLRASIKTA